MGCKLGSLGLLVLAAVLAVAVGCAGGRKEGVSEEIAALEGIKVRADAYLFDTRVVRVGKPTSVRLEIYYTDTLVGIGGRGYLGKGALKGWLTEDSLEVYFPSSNEYVYAAVKTLLESEQCPETEVDVPLAGLLSTTPDSLEMSGGLVVEADYEDAEEPVFVIRGRDCPWQLEITYDRYDDRWQVDRFEFDNGSDLSLKAERRAVRRGAEVEARRFAVAIPGDALRIEP